MGKDRNTGDSVCQFAMDTQASIWTWIFRPHIVIQWCCWEVFLRGSFVMIPNTGEKWVCSGCGYDMVTQVVVY